MKKIWYRLYQICFGVGSRFLRWREPECVIGVGAIAQVPELLKKYGGKKPLIVCSKRQSEVPSFAQMTAQLTEKSYYLGVEPNPRVATVERIVAQYKAEGCDSFLAVGGGSPMDAAKAAAARIARPNKTVAQLGGLLKVHHKIPLLIAVPTTAGTGSETTIAAVVTDEEHHKYAVGDLCLVPHCAVLDAQLTASMSPRVTAQTGLDALTHAVEAYVGKYFNTAYTRRMAEEAVVDIFRYLERACQDGNDLEAREKMLLASYKAGVAFTRASVGNVHAVAHTLGGLYDVPHGLANAVLLPVILRDYGAAVYAPLAKLATLCGMRGETEQEKATAVVDEIFALNQRLGIPDGFDGIQEGDLPKMAAWADAEANPTYPVPVIYGKEDFTRIIRAVMR